MGFYKRIISYNIFYELVMYIIIHYSKARALMCYRIKMVYIEMLMPNTSIFLTG